MTTRSRRPSNFIASVVVLSMVATSCDFGGEATTTTTTVEPTTTTTTEALPELPPSPSTTTSLPPGVDAGSAEATAERVTQLMRVTQSLRALEFLERPAVQIVDDATMAALIDRLALAPLGDPAFAVEQRLQALLGMLPIGFSASALYGDYYDGLPVALFEYETNTLHVIVRGDGFTPLEESVIVRETVRALTTEYFGITTDYAGRVPTSVSDEALATAALVEGDATYFQLLYLQGLSDEQRDTTALEAQRLAWDAPGGTPRWLVERLAFPYDDGLVFARRIIEAGGIAAIDRAYADPPVSSEHILHPERYLRGDSVFDVEPIEVDIAGFAVHGEGRFGELAWRALLSRTLEAGILTQTVDGWIGDAYVAVGNVTDVGIMIRMEALSEEDAIEIAQGLIAHSRTTLGAGEGADVDGGILFDEGGPYVFIDRIDTAVVLVVASDRGLGAELKAAA